MTAVDAEVSVVWLPVARRPDAADRLLAAEVARVTGTLPDEVRIVRSCHLCGSAEHGTPTVLTPRGEPAPSVSISRAEGIAMVAVSGAGPVGVDVERPHATRFAGFANVALHPREHAASVEARATLWARKESLLKATGDALHLDPGSIRVSDADEPPRLVEWPGPTPPTAQMWDLEVPGWAAAVTVLSDTVPRLTVRQEAVEALSG